MNIQKLQVALTHPLLITDERMIEYLLGQRFHVSERFLGLLIQKDSVKLFLNDLFPTDLKNCTLIRFNDADDAIHILSTHLHDPHLHIDRQMQAGFLLRLMKLKPELNFEIDTLADTIRSIKNVDEQAKMRKASLINDAVMSLVPSFLNVGVSELEVAKLIEKCFMDCGADALSFPCIVAFGDHAADPHAMPSERKLTENESIIIDMGCRKDGYCSDMTRTFFMKNNSMKVHYDLVHQANLAAIAKIKPGVMFKEIDEAARFVITQGGYGDAFIHRTGHGIGQDVHEPFDVSSVNEKIVEAGMTFSIEPGIYIEGLGGIRIEDLVLVTETGCEVLNHYPKNQEIL